MVDSTRRADIVSAAGERGAPSAGSTVAAAPGGCAATAAGVAAFSIIKFIVIFTLDEIRHILS